MKEGALNKIKNHWKELKRQAQAVRYKKNQILFYEGHLPYGIYILKAGDLFFTRSEKECVEEHLSQIQRDRVVCVENILAKTPHSCTCYAQSDCEVLFISKTQLIHCLDEKNQGP